MAFYAKDEYIGDGSNDVFNITFPYLNRDLIKVYINDVEDPAITFLTDTQIKTSVVPEDGAIVQLARNTPLDRRVDFKNASLLDSQILDEDSMQMMHIVQEAYDGLENTMGRGTANDWNAEGLPISHVGDPVDPDDAMNMRSAMSYLEATEDARDQAVVARSEAESAETGAETAEANAGTSEANALIYKNDAETARTDAESAEAGAVSAKDSAVIAKTGAETAETNAGTSEANALIYKNDTETARTGAETAEAGAVSAKDSAVIAKTGAETAETNAESAEAGAETAEANALASENKAEKWAEENEDVEVEPNQYSAFHWAKKAQAEAGSVIGMQVHDNTWHSEDFETTTGAQSKANTAETNANSYTDGAVRTNEEIQDVIGALVQAGANVSIDYDDVANTLTISSSFTNTQRSDEEIQDVVGALVQGGSNVTASYDDVSNTLTISATDTNTQRSDSEIQDVVQPLFNEVDNSLANIINKLPDNAGAHNSIYRGVYLGSEVTTEQYDAISNGTFEDLYIGDYWTIGGVNYRIAAFNYYYNAGDAALTNNHVTLVPDDNLYTHAMNDTNTTDGGYINSKMYIEGLDSAKTTINSAFGSHVVNHRKYLCNAVSSGEQSGGSWYDSEVELMNEVMVYGSVVNGGAAKGLYNIGAEKTQLPLFALRPDIANIRSAYWLRDVASATYFANVTSSGIAVRNLASDAFGVRPTFSIS